MLCRISILRDTDTNAKEGSRIVPAPAVKRAGYNAEAIVITRFAKFYSKNLRTCTEMLST